MDKQEKIREGMEKIAYFCKRDCKVCLGEQRMFLHKSGVVLKVDRERTASICGYCELLESCKETHSECGKFELESGYVAWEPLVGGNDV